MTQQAHDVLRAYQATTRDRLASSLANCLLNLLATRPYRELLDAVIQAGLVEAIKRDPQNPPFTEPLDDSLASDDKEPS